MNKNSDIFMNDNSNLNENDLDDDILQKINDEAKKFENNEIISGNDIYDKYNKVTENQFKELFQEKK